LRRYTSIIRPLGSSVVSPTSLGEITMASKKKPKCCLLPSLQIQLRISRPPEFCHLSKLSSLQSTITIFLLQMKFGSLALLLLNTGGALAAPANTTSPNTNTTTVEGPSNATAPLIDGRCKWKWAEALWKCPRKGFECIKFVCVDARMPEQKEADKQEKADGRDGRFLFTFDTGNHTCTQRGF
jgi:hypothetical protein